MAKRERDPKNKYSMLQVHDKTSSSFALWQLREDAARLGASAAARKQINILPMAR